MPAGATTHAFKVTLQDDPAIYREIEVESRRSLADLAKAIVAAFDFEFEHAFGFYSSGRDLMRAKPKFELFADMGEETDAGSVKKTRIKDAFPNVGHTMLFLFDYGDDWRFVVGVTGVGEKEPRARYPRVLKKVGASPEQYGMGDEDDD